MGTQLKENFTETLPLRDVCAFCSCIPDIVHDAVMMKYSDSFSSL
jgi:hypothetical protein